jgi:hypothetical protein
MNMQPSDQLDKFLRSKQRVVSKYSRWFRVADVLAITFLFYAILLALNMDQLFSMIDGLAPYTTGDLRFGSLSIGFNDIALFILSFILAMAVVFFLCRRKSPAKAINVIENKCPPLRERLRTAYDNRTSSGVIAVDLVQSVILSAKEEGIWDTMSQPPRVQSVILSTKEVKNSLLLDRKRMKFTLMFLAFSILLAGGVVVSEFRTDITPSDIKDSIESLPFIPEGGSSDPDVSPYGDGDSSGGTAAGDDTSITLVAGEEVDLTLPPGSESGFDPSENENSETPDFEASGTFAGSTLAASAYYEDLPEGYEDIIQSYFEAITRQ